MAKRKSEHTDFITICETNHNLYIIAITSMPSCSLYDVINGGFSLSRKGLYHTENHHPGVLQRPILSLWHTVFEDIQQKTRKRN